jgi:hypothetical protein
LQHRVHPPLYFSECANIGRLHLEKPWRSSVATSTQLAKKAPLVEAEHGEQGAGAETEAEAEARAAGHAASAHVATVPAGGLGAGAGLRGELGGSPSGVSVGGPAVHEAEEPDWSRRAREISGLSLRSFRPPGTSGALALVSACVHTPASSRAIQECLRWSKNVLNLGIASEAANAVATGVGKAPARAASPHPGEIPRAPIRDESAENASGPRRKSQGSSNAKRPRTPSPISPAPASPSTVPASAPRDHRASPVAPMFAERAATGDSDGANEGWAASPGAAEAAAATGADTGLAAIPPATEMHAPRAKAHKRESPKELLVRARVRHARPLSSSRCVWLA